MFIFTLCLCVLIDGVTESEILVGGLMCFFRFIMRKVTAKHSGAAMDNLLRKAADILRVFASGKWWENPWDWGTLRINPAKTPYITYTGVYWVYRYIPCKRLLWGVEQLGYHPESTTRDSLWFWGVWIAGEFAVDDVFFLLGRYMQILR